MGCHCPLTSAPRISHGEAALEASCRSRFDYAIKPHLFKRLAAAACRQRDVAFADTLSPAARAPQTPGPQPPAAAGLGGMVVADTLAGTGWGSGTLASQGLLAATAGWGPETSALQRPSAAPQAAAASAAATQPATPGGPSPDPNPDPCARWTPAQRRSARRVRSYDRRALASGSVHAAALA